MAKSNSDFIDIPALVRQYISKWYLFVISVVICGGIAVAYALLRQQDYSVKANILITPEKDSPLAGGLMDGLGSLFGSQGYVEDEIFIISSHSLYASVAKNLGLNVSQNVKKNILVRELAYPDQPLEVVPQAGIMDTLRTGITFIVKVKDDGTASIKGKIKRSTVVNEKNLRLPFTVDTPLGTFSFAKTEYFPIDEDINVRVSVKGYGNAAEDLAKEVTTEIAAKHSNVLAIGMDTPNPEYGTAVLNEIFKEYNERGIEESRQRNQLTATFIEGRLKLLAAELSDVEAVMQKYKQTNSIVDVEIEAKYQTEKRGKVESELLAAETQAEIIKLTLQFLRDPRNAYALIPTSLDNEGLQKAIAAYNELVLERMSLAGSARSENIALKELSDRIDASRENIITSISRAYDTAMVTVTDLRREMRAAEGSLATIPSQEREYRDLARQQTVKQELFVFLLQRQEETAMLLANAYPKGQIVDKAYTETEPLGMSKKMIALLGLLFGLIMPPVYLYLRKLVHNRFETRADVERITEVPILGEMCIDSRGSHLVVRSEDTSATSELFRLMRSNLLFVMNDPRDKVVLLTSTSSGEGKSFISINLAASLALLGKKVLLVGMDIRNPRLAEYLGINPRFGLTQYLASSTIAIDQMVTSISAVAGLDVICAGPVPPNPAELLLSDKVDSLFAELREMYDYIIVDTAPIGLVSDTFTLNRIADAAIYVCRANYTSLNDLTLVNDIYEQHRLKKVSLVINGTASKKTYGYGAKKTHR